LVDWIGEGLVGGDIMGSLSWVLTILHQRAVQGGGAGTFPRGPFATKEKKTKKTPKGEKSAHKYPREGR